jgi:hypothetical protein
MKTMTKNILIGSVVSAGGAAVATAVYKKKKKDKFPVEDDIDMRNSTELDEMESVDADKTDEEKGLTQLDHTYRAEWVANGFPQTHMEAEKLKEDGDTEEKDN